MGKKLYYLDDYEKKRILELHSKSKKNQINEQGLLTYYGASVPTSVTDVALGPLSIFYKTYKTVTHTSNRDDKVSKIDAYCKAETGGTLKKPIFDDFVAATRGTGYMSDNTYKKVLKGLKEMSGKDYCATSKAYFDYAKTPLVHKFLEYIYSLDAENEVLNTILKLIPPPPQVETPNTSDESSSPPGDVSYEQPQSSDTGNQQTSQEQLSNSGTQQSSNNPVEVQQPIKADYRVLTPKKIEELRKKIGSTSTGNQLTQDDLTKIMEKIKQK
jgi:hypothetical protein